MADFSDPLLYAGIATSVAAVATIASKLHFERKSNKSYIEKLQHLLELMPDDEPRAHASLKERYKWAEAIFEIDRMTLPRRRVAYAVALGVLSFLLFVSALTCILFGSSYSGLDIDARVYFIYVGFLLLAVSVFSAMRANECAEPRYRLGGRVMRSYSPHVLRLRSLRRELGLETSEDRLAYRHAVKRSRRWKRFCVGMRRASHPISWVLAVRRASRVSRSRSSGGRTEVNKWMPAS